MATHLFHHPAPLVTRGLAAALVCLLVVPAAWAAGPSAGYSGPSAIAPVRSVRAILDNPVDDQAVVLEGHVVRQLVKETYVFSDGSGQIQIEIDDDDLPLQGFDHTTRVQITGEVDTRWWRSPEVDVDQVRVLGAAPR